MSDCSCVWVDTSWDGPACTSVHTRKARKEHRCYECRTTIKRGERYEETTGIWDGDPHRYRTCLDCVSVRKAFFCEGWTYGSIWDDLYEHLRDCWYTTPVDALSKLTDDARKDVCEFIEERWEEMDDAE